MNINENGYTSNALKGYIRRLPTVYLLNAQNSKTSKLSNMFLNIVCINPRPGIMYHLTDWLFVSRVSTSKTALTMYIVIEPTA